MHNTATIPTALSMFICEVAIMHTIYEHSSAKNENFSLHKSAVCPCNWFKLLSFSKPNLIPGCSEFVRSHYSCAVTE